MIELNFVSDIQDKIDELKELYESTDSRDLQNKALWQIEILEEVALPYAKMYNYNLAVLSECRDKLIRKLESDSCGNI